MNDPPPRTVTLRQERYGQESRHLWAYVDGSGDLHIDGQDLGPSTAPVSDDGEYEWFQTIAAADIPAVVALLGGAPGDDVLEVLEQYSGARSYELERRLRESSIRISRSVY